jgi:hypothetical protein
MDRLLARDHGAGPDAAVVAGHEHWPFGQRHEQGVVDLELHRDLDGAVARVETGSLDVGRQLAQQSGRR